MPPKLFEMIVGCYSNHNELWQTSAEKGFYDFINVAASGLNKLWLSQKENLFFMRAVGMSQITVMILDWRLQ